MAASSTSVYAAEIADIVAIQRANSSRLMSSVSYVYDYAAENGEQNEFYGNHVVFRRAGDKFLHIDSWSGIHPTRGEMKEKWDATFVITSFDGKLMRKNSVMKGFLHYLAEPAQSEILPTVTSFDVIQERDASGKLPRVGERPAEARALPSGIIEEGMGEDDVGHFFNDTFLKPAVFVPSFGDPFRWSDLLSNGTAVVKSFENGKAEIEVFESAPPKVLLDRNASKTRKTAKEISQRYTYRVKVDLERGGLVVEAAEYDNKTGTKIAELTDVRVEQDSSTGVWYPVHYLFKTAKPPSTGVFDLVDISFKSVPEDSFEGIWFDEQIVYDKRDKRGYRYLKQDIDTYKEDYYGRLDVMSQVIRRK